MESDGDSKICTLLLSREATAGLAFGAAGGPGPRVLLECGLCCRPLGLRHTWPLLTQFFFFFFFFSTSLSFAREIRVALPGYGTAAAGGALPIPTQYFHVSRQWYGCQCLGILTCAHMLIRAIAYWGLYGHRKRVCSGRKIACRGGDSNPRQYCAWLFSQTLYQLSYRRPVSLAVPSCFGKKRS